MAAGRLTYTDLKNQFLRNTNNANVTSTTNPNLFLDFQMNLGQRYQLALSKLQAYTNQKPSTFATVAAQQYYDYPINIMSTGTVTVTVGSVNYPLDTIYSQTAWDILNSIQIQPTSIPQFIFPRSAQFGKSGGGGFGIWPIPQGVYTGTFNAYIRDRNMSIDDITGTASVSNVSTVGTITGTGFTSAMVGRWFIVNDATATQNGYSWLITGYTSSTVLTVFQPFTTTESSITYRIGESPILPEEGHIILADGATADFYGGMRKDAESATFFNNRFWTGDGFNKSREIGSDNVSGGLINLLNTYGDRDSKRLISSNPRTNSFQWKIWSTVLSS